MFDEANSLCTTSNLPLSAREATKGLLSATMPSAEAMLGCIHEREQKTETLKRFSKQCCSCHCTAQFILTKPPERLQGSRKRGRFLYYRVSTRYSSRTKGPWHPLKRNLCPIVSFPPAQLLSLQITLNYHSCSENSSIPLAPTYLRGFYYYFCQNFMENGSLPHSFSRFNEWPQRFGTSELAKAQALLLSN